MYRPGREVCRRVAGRSRGEGRRERRREGRRERRREGRREGKKCTELMITAGHRNKNPVKIDKPPTKITDFRSNASVFCPNAFHKL